MIQMTDLSLKQVKSEMVDRVVDEIGMIPEVAAMTEHERVLYKQRLLTQLNERKLAMSVREQSGQTNSADYNKTAFEMYLDMMTTFTYLDDLYNLINSHIQLNQGIINSLHSSIGTLEDKLEEYGAIMGTVGSPYCYVEGFRTSNNQETDRKYYTERYGEKMPEAAYARHNQDQETLTLNYARQQNVMVYKNGIQLGKISITKQYGAGFITARNSETKLENAIDTSMSSYWSDTILSDTEFKISGSGFDTSEGIISNRSYYDLPRGALCEICLTFEALAKVNEIVLSPFGNFPIDVIAIRYSLTDDEDDDVYDVLCPDNDRYAWLQETSVRMPTAFHFPEITCKRLYILINQLHFIKNTYLISSNQMFKNRLWFNATNDDGSDLAPRTTDVFSPVYLDKAQEQPVWKYIMNEMSRGKTLNMNEILLTNNDRHLPVTKYEYTYGFYNIAPNFSEFQRTGVYVTKEISVGGSIKTVRLTSDESHYLSSEGFTVTDIEFYITAKKNPAYSDWHPICPANKDYVYRERMQLDYAYCYLRHKAVCGNFVTKDKSGNEKMVSIRPIVYMNDIVMTENADYILRFDDDGSVSAIEVSNIDHFALYTCSYQPVDTAKEVTLIEFDNPVPNAQFEQIIGNGTACYQLSSYPYYNQADPELTNSYVKIINTKDSTVINQTSHPDSPIQCVTNKLSPSESFKNFNPATNRIQYYTNGNRVFFNRPITSLEKIEINYPAFESSIRLKAILRRNTKRDGWITPVLNSFKLEFTTM